MTTFEIFAPRWCSASYLEHDGETEACRFATDVEWLVARGVPVVRATLSEHPGRFVEHDAVRFLMNLMGADVLPVILVDGVMRSHGTYPPRETLAAWAGVELEEAAPPTPPVPSTATSQPQGDVGTARVLQHSSG